MRAVTRGASRNQIACANGANAAAPCLPAQAALTEALGMEVILCGTRNDDRPGSA